MFFIYNVVFSDNNIYVKYLSSPKETRIKKTSFYNIYYTIYLSKAVPKAYNSI